MRDATAYTPVGARELKTRLGTYLRQVRSGATFIVTERGRPVAELRPLVLAEHDPEARIQELIALGAVSREERVPLEAFEPVAVSGAPLAEAVIEDREDRL